MKSPFLFLEGATEKTVAKVHSIILSSDPAQQKHADIQDNIPQELKPAYDDWTRKKRHDPPMEVLRELKPNMNSLLYRNLANKKWDEIWSIFGYLTPATRQIADQWFAIIINDDRLTEDALQNAKETLIQLRERGCIRDYEFKHSVSESVEHYNYIENEATVTSSTVTTRQSHMQLYTNNPPGYAPKIEADISSIDGNHEQRQSTYGHDYGWRGSNQESRSVCDKESHQYRNDTKRMSETREEDHTIQPVEKEIRYGCSTGEPSMKLDIDRSKLADTAAKFPSSNRRTSATTHNEQNVNKEETAQKKELATTLENAENMVSSHQASKNRALTDVIVATEAKEEEPPARPSTPPPRPSVPVKQDFSIGDVDPKNVFNILLLGETGVGKTTFINSFANYVKYATLDEALEKTPVILMKSSISLAVTKANNDGIREIRQKVFTVKANSENGQKNSINENLEDGGESKTQEPLIHSIPFEEDGIPKLLRIIDTPGVNDTRGRNQDDANFNKIIKLIGKLENLRAICILLKPNESALTHGFRLCLDYVLAKLHRSATKNILFCFTNTRSTLYRPGDTMASLTVYLKELEKSTGIMITLNKHNIFCFDNDCFRYMCILMKFPQSKKEDIYATMLPGWAHNVQECKKLLRKIQGLAAHQVEDTVNINNIRTFLIALAKPLIEIAINHKTNIRIVEKKIEEVHKIGKRGEQLESIVAQKQYKLYITRLPYPMTVCTSPKCMKTVRGTDGHIYQVPKKVCHNKCTLADYRIALPRGDVGIKSCSIFQKNYSENQKSVFTENCQVCGCSWKIHMHQTYESEERRESIASLEDQHEFRNCRDSGKRAEMALKEFTNQLENMDNEYNLIKTTSFEFSAFLQFNSMKSEIDPYLDFLCNEVDLQKNLAEYTGDKSRVLDLLDLLKDYEKEVSHNLEELKEGRMLPMTTPELWKKVDNLSKMKLSGELIASIAQAIKKEQQAPPAE